jgi:hypothetical protein
MQSMQPRAFACKTQSSPQVLVCRMQDDVEITAEKALAFK